MKCGVKNIENYHGVVGVKTKFKRILKNVKLSNINAIIKQLVIKSNLQKSFFYFFDIDIDMQMDSPDPTNIITER
jgi:hypothetical protein